MKNVPGRSRYGKAGQRFSHRGTLLAFAVVMGVCALFLAGCTGTTSLSNSDNGKTITVHVGDEIDIALDSNPTTGYDWTIEKSNNALLTFKQMDYQASSNLVGSGGTDTFKFVAKSAGSVNLQLKYWRSFEGDRSIIHRYAVTIQVQA
jgi:inhibitor of cysteine peptidase